jgi:flagellin-like hook-associated protein FlgL
MSDITLSAGVRQNLLSLQNTAELMSKTQNRLATGKKVNSALDNPTNFFTAQSLQSRAGDMASLLDNMTTGIKTLEAADNGLSAITKTIESMQSTLRQARQDRSFKSEDYTLDTATIGNSVLKNLTFSGGSVGTTPVNIGLNNTSAATAGTATVTFGAGGTLDTAATLDFTVTVDGVAQNVSITQAEVQAVGNADTSIDDGDEFRAILATQLTGVTIGGTGATVTVTSDTTGATSDVDFGVATIGGTVGTSTITPTTAGLNVAINGTAGAALGATASTPKTVDQLVAEINANTNLQGKVRASNDTGRLRIENLSTQELEIIGVSGTDDEIDGSLGAANTATIEGNAVRANLVKQFNELRDQLDKLADDASYNGVNLLRGDLLKLIFNETGTSTIEIQAKDLEGDERPINTSTLGITVALEPDFDSDATIDARLSSLTDALGVLRSQSSAFGSNLSIVENRTEFTKAMINTLQTGADSLVLADTNEEAANMLALQTRQQLSSTALSLASQADQAVLRLF